MSLRAGSATIVRRELASYFNSPIASIVLFVFVALIGSLFMAQFFLLALADMRAFFNIVSVVVCVFLPAVTMRLWAEEKKGNTFEMLLTFPMRPHQLVLGKFFASFLFYVLALLATLTVPIMLSAVGQPDPGPILGGYLGAALLGAFYLAIGLFVSGLCRDQIVAFIVAMLSCFGFFLLGTQFIATSIDGWVSGLGTWLRTYVGMTSHVVSFQRGVLDVRDVVYFAVGTALFLILNGFWIEGRLRPRQRRIFATAVALAGVIFVLTNWLIGDLALGRYDLTQGKLYTISPVTRKILNDLKAPVTVKYYVSPQEKMPTAFKTLEQDVVSALDELRLVSDGKLQYKVFHLEASNVAGQAQSEESLETSLQRKGIEPFQVQSVEADEMGVKLVYSALTIGYKEKPEEHIPQLIPTHLDELEYLLLSKIYRMTLARQPKVAVVAPYQETPVDERMRAVLEQLGRKVPEAHVEDKYRLVPLALEHAGYETVRASLAKDEPLPEGTTTLVVLEPRELTDEQRAAINRFLVGGGAVFLGVQQYEFKYVQSSVGEIEVEPQDKSPGLEPLLRPWGVGLERRLLFDQHQDVITISAGMRMGPFALSVPVKLPVHIRIDQQGMNQDLSITSRLPSMLYLWGSALTLDEQQLAELKLTSHVLLHSSPDSWLGASTEGRLTPDDLDSAKAKTHGPFPLAVLVEGQFPTTQSDARLTPAPGKLLLVGAVTPFQEQLLQMGGHLPFLLNAVDALTLQEDLTQVRAKQTVDRSIERVSSAMKAWWRFFTSLLVPLVIVCLGWVRMLIRRRVKIQYLRLVKAVS